MLDYIPTPVFPFFFAVVALVAGRLLGGSAKEDPESLPRVMLYAIAGACVVIGFVAIWLSPFHAKP